jgi:hypothetical protein
LTDEDFAKLREVENDERQTINLAMSDGKSQLPTFPPRMA